MGRNQLFKKLGLKKLAKLSVVMLGAYVVTGCPNPTVSQFTTQSGAQQAIAQEAAQSSVNYEVCADVENWQRPSEAVQAKRLSADARYGEAVQTGALKAASDQFWNRSVVSFTTYGLSARMEPENLSGVWTAVDEMANCYAPEDTVAINEGDRAETWLLNQRISSLEWTGDRYLMTVESAPSGLQVIQFDRIEEVAVLPLEVIDTNGESVGVMSGDWQ